MSLPSVRECMHRLDRMRDTESVVIADLQKLDDELFKPMLDGDTGANEIAHAIARLRALHQLCRDLAANMNGGFAVPPTAPPAPPKKLQVVPPGTRAARPSPTTWTDVAIEQRLHEPKATPAPTPTRRSAGQRVRPIAPPGMVTSAEFAERLGVSMGNFYQLVGRTVPKATLGFGRGHASFWDEAEVALALARRAASPGAHRQKVITTTPTAAKAA